MTLSQKFKLWVTLWAIVFFIIMFISLATADKKGIAEEKEVDYWRCVRTTDVEAEFIRHWTETAEKWCELLASENCPEFDCQYLKDIEEEEKGWYPWKLTADGDHQEMPEIESNTSHERFKEMANKYWLDASKIRQVEQYYWITEAVVLCITVSETSWWNRWAGWANIWSVGSNDRWDRPTYALMESWLEAIWKTLTNKYLWSIQTLWCLSNAWSCQQRDDNWKRYATSNYNWEANMKSCLSTIYWPINPATFNIRNR